MGPPIILPLSVNAEAKLKAMGLNNIEIPVLANVEAVLSFEIARNDPDIDLITELEEKNALQRIENEPNILFRKYRITEAAIDLLYETYLIP